MNELKNRSTRPSPRPTKMAVKKTERCLDILFDDSAHFKIPAELLRVESPSAEIQNHGGPKNIPGGKRRVEIVGAEAVGHYAVKLIFNDGHDSGIYTWDYLYDLGVNQDSRFKAYLAALKLKHLSRD